MLVFCNRAKNYMTTYQKKEGRASDPPLSACVRDEWDCVLALWYCGMHLLAVAESLPRRCVTIQGQVEFKLRRQSFARGFMKLICINKDINH